MVIMCISKFGLVSYCELHVSCVRDVNYRDRLAVAVVRSGVIVGHIPRKVNMFNVVQMGGSISFRVTGYRR